MSGTLHRVRLTPSGRLTFHVYPAPSGERVLIAVTEGRRAAGKFVVTVEAWERARRSFTPVGVRVRDYPA